MFAAYNSCSFTQRVTGKTLPVYFTEAATTLLVLALNRSSYRKCSLEWCQVRTSLLFTIWTHPLLMREYPLQYAGTDRNKKSHYSSDRKKYCQYITNCIRMKPPMPNWNIIWFYLRNQMYLPSMDCRLLVLFRCIGIAIELTIILSIFAFWCMKN